ncbi:MAG: response regulator, partial [Burkholderiales bacterium]|nr:response regulator [Burkholderiales bacterium]
VRLPRLVPASVEAPSPDEPPARVVVHPAPPPSPGRGVVVLIEDDPQVRESTALVLQQHGWQVAGAANPDAALSLIAQMQDDGRMPEGDMPAALVSDHRLGLSVNGLEVLKQLRYEFGEHLPALLLTGEIPAPLADEASRAGVQLVSKPIEAERLVELLCDATADAPTDAA